MQAFAVLHKPTGKFLNSAARASRTSDVLRATKGEIFFVRAHATHAIRLATTTGIKGIYPKVLHGSKRSDYSVKAFEIDFKALKK